MQGRSRWWWAVLGAVLAVRAGAAAMPFDLAGPAVQVTVTRAGETLPLAQVPNLAEGDVLKLRAELPATQAADYLLVLAFLRGSTNPPPEKWFFACKTWRTKNRCNRDGLTVTVPPGAQQAVLFLAPSTGGDFDTLVSAVQGRPGAFVRAAQDLNQAALDRARLQRYLDTVQALDQTNPAALKQAAPLLARSLAIRVDEKCLDRLPQLQAPCLTSGQETLILTDGHSRSIVETLTASPGADLLLQVSATPEGGSGYYSPYILSVIDVARILDSFSTARYQYIPALGSPAGERLRLTLNTAPSFREPMSVLVAALPAVEPAQLPPLHAVEPDAIHCASAADLVLPVEGAPLVFATDFAHGLALELTASDGRVLSLPARADGVRGGYVIDTSALRAAPLGDAVRATLKGRWGFTPYVGPSFQLRNAQAANWTVAAGAGNALVVGRQESVHLRADSVACIDQIMARDPNGKELRAEWRKTRPDEVELLLPLQNAAPGALTLLIQQHGAPLPVEVAVQTFAGEATVTRLVLHAGDREAVLTGSRLDTVARVQVGALALTPGELATDAAEDRLRLSASEAADLAAGQRLTAEITLKDGRRLKQPVTVAPARPQLRVLGRSVARAPAVIALQDDELTPGEVLTFSVRAEGDARFGREHLLEVAGAEGRSLATLSLADGSLRLENAQVAVGRLDAKRLPPETFGELNVRRVRDGLAGDWQPLAHLLRLPTLRGLACEAPSEARAVPACVLAGEDLFLIEAVSATAGFEQAVVLPEGFTGTALAVPAPVGDALYLRLRDRHSVARRIDLKAPSAP